jgi:GrpB-like predicted nucleotidyltransferase (UPF0157 family)
MTGLEMVDAVHAATEEAVILAPYDARWPIAFEAERIRLMSRFPEFLGIEHFGSTAVAGVAAKPIVDMLAGVESMAVAEALFDPIVAFGYHTSRTYNDMLPDRRWFMRVTDGKRTHHLHVVEFDGQQWRERLRFRDALRADRSLRTQYVALKMELAVRHANDREAYTEGKSGFVASVLRGS